MAPKDYKILGAQSCPRCNAKAKLKAVQNNLHSDAVAIIIDCPACKMKFITGFASKKQMEKIERHDKLLKKYKEAKTPLERGKIMKEVSRLDNEMEDWFEGTLLS